MVQLRLTLEFQGLYLTSRPLRSLSSALGRGHSVTCKNEETLAGVSLLYGRPTSLAIFDPSPVTMCGERVGVSTQYSTHTCWIQGSSGSGMQL